MLNLKWKYVSQNDGKWTVRYIETKEDLYCEKTITHDLA
jgi:hypothetical protein